MNYLNDKVFKNETDKIRELIHEFINSELSNFCKNYDVKLKQTESRINNSFSIYLLENHPEKITAFFS